MTARETYVLCEGFHDRHFLAGFAERRGWRGPTRRADGGFDRFKDPGGMAIVGGVFGYYRTDEFLRVVPVRGDTSLFRSEEPRIVSRRTNRTPLARVVICTDADAPDETGILRRRAQFATWVRALGGVLESPDQGTLEDVDLRLVVWRTETNDDLPGVPRHHTLERIVCMALARNDAARADAVRAFMQGSPEPAGPKQHAWSYMARWFGDRGCEDFYEAVWEDPPVAAALARTMTAIGLEAALGGA